ncbi:alpha/beta fold hydrolase [Rathayibacter sp. KR2-224]|uniref:alpha/beta fold hydrolase n=1 Tax=Rathayibacter sp. KR2-224 TaxID=3400913 RepID=UPI003C0D3E93
MRSHRSRTPSRRSPRPDAVVTFDRGAPAAETFILVHGIGVSSRYFERLAPLLARHGRTIALDLPGFGRAPRPSRPYTVEDYADVVARVLDDRKLVHCVIVGHSMGAQIATRLAVVRPDLVSRLVLIGPVMAPVDRSPLRAAWRLFGDMTCETARSNRLVMGDYLRCGPRWYLAVLPSMLGYRLEDVLPTVPAPVLLVRGARDPVARRDWVSLLARAARSSRTVEIQGSPHVAMHVRSQDVERAIVAG